MTTLSRPARACIDAFMSETILITGVAGSLARHTAQALAAQGHTVVGMDYRPRPDDLPDDMVFYQANYNKTRIEEAFRNHNPSVVLHLGRVGNLKVHLNKRFDLNVIGSAKVMELCLKYKVRRLLILSTFHIYGAHPQNHIPISEDDPIRAGQTFPQLADAIQLDNQAITWMYKHPELHSIVLRPCNVIGPRIHNAISRYLRSSPKLYVAGFNPMWQFIHETDLIEAILLATGSDVIGVYNVAGGGTIPIVHALKLTKSTMVPIPAPAADLYLKVASQFKPAFPPYLLNFFKYPCVITDEMFRDAFGYAPTFGIEESIRSCVDVSSP